MRTVVFDLDGTLADTSADLIASANHCFRGLGLGDVLDPVADALTAFHGGRAMLRLGFERLGRPDEAEVARQYPILLAAYSEAIDVHTRMYPGAVAAVEALRAAGFATAICTNKPEGLAETLTRRLGVRDLFGALVGADTLPVRKPDPAPYQECLRRVGGTRSILIGDTETDRLTGAAAGVPVALVTFGPEGRGVARLSPEALLDHYDDLPELAERLLRIDPGLPTARTQTMEHFTGSFTQQEPIPEAGIAAALAVLRHGRLHRYNTAPGEVAETALLEEEFAALTGARYCLAVASGGYAMGCALRAVGVGPGERVLSNGFTLAPVPGAIASVGAVPVFVEVTDDLTICLDDLAAKLDQAKVLLLSHMRGHVCDMDRLMALCDAAGVVVVEDCAHTMGAAWRGVPSGRHGRVACYSTQTYKHANSGEGGLLISDDAAVMARAVLLSGSYMLYARHRAAPPPEAFEALKYDTPNISGRMDNLRAAILRPQLAGLADRVARWAERYRVMEAGLAGAPGMRLIPRPEHEAYVGSSFQFLLPGWEPARVQALLGRCAARGVELKWFGAGEPVAFTSRYDHWRYAAPAPLPRTDKVLAGLIDMRLPLTFSTEDVALIARIIRAELGAVWQGEVAAVASQAAAD